MQKPRLIKIRGKVQLCMITYDKGEITDINGPIQCISDLNAHAEDFVNNLCSMAVEALHTCKVLGLNDLPEVIRTKIIGDLAEADKVQESSSSSDSSSSK